MEEYCKELTCFAFFPCSIHATERQCAICSGSMRGTHSKATICLTFECRRTNNAQQRAKHQARPIEKKVVTPLSLVDFGKENMRFLALTTPGLELYCHEELNEKLGRNISDSFRVLTPPNAQGRVLFDCEPTPLLFNKLRHLLSVDRLVAVVWTSQSIPHDGCTWKLTTRSRDSEEERKKKKEQREQEIKQERQRVLSCIENELFIHGSWERAFECYSEWQVFVNDSDVALYPPKVRFRASCVREGTHIFKSQELAGSVGGATARKFRWTVDLDDFNSEVFVHVVDNELICGITLYGPQHHGNQRFRAPLLPGFEPLTALKPSTAYAMAKMARLQPGEVVCDPFAGIGTIPIEAVHSWPDVLCLGGDVYLESLRQASLNSQYVRRSADWVHWDVGALPLRDGCLDVVISDLPFGLRHGKFTSIAPLYSFLVRELERVLNPKTNSRAYLLTIVSNTLRAVLERSPVLQINSVVDCVIGGLRAKIFCVCRKA